MSQENIIAVRVKSSILAIVTKFIRRQERSIVGKIGAGEPFKRAFRRQRWLKELRTDLVVAGEDLDFATQISQTVVEEIEDVLGNAYRYDEKYERMQAARSIYADLECRILPLLTQQEDKSIGPGYGNQILYKLYDIDDILLYVGITERGPARLVEHYRDKEWFTQVVRVEFERYPIREMVLERERIAIQTLHPLYNIQHNLPLQDVL